MESPCHVIIADDDADMRSLIARSVNHMGANVVSRPVTNGQEALWAYSNFRADLLITDVDMPRVDGLTLVRTLRSRAVIIPIIVTSGYPLHEQAAVTVGATLFLEKTVLVQELKNLLPGLIPTLTVLT